MMQKENEQKKAVVSVSVTADKLRQIYDILDDEQMPFEARVKNIGKGIREITIETDADCVEHFKSILL